MESPVDTSSSYEVWPPNYAGWFRDPWGQHTVRYFDGKGWTGRGIGGPEAVKEKGFFGALASYAFSRDWENEAVSLLGAKSTDKIAGGMKGINAAKVWYFFPFALMGLMTVFFLFSANDENESAPTFISLQLSFFLFLLLPVSVAIFVKCWREITVVKDVPTVPVTGAHIGLCEFQGTVEPYYAPTMSWMGNVPTIWTETRIDEYVKRDKGGGSWEQRWKNADGQPIFYLKDAHGHRILVDLNGYSDSSWATIHIKETYDNSNKHRVTERGLAVGGNIFVLGHVQVVGNGSLVVTKRTHPGNLPPKKNLFMAFPGTEEEVLSSHDIAVKGTLAQLALTWFLLSLFMTYGILGPSFMTFAAGLVLAAAGAAVGGTVLWGWRTWNRLVEVKWRIGAAWSLIDVASQRRHDIIPALQAVAAGAAAHERSTQKRVASLRVPTPQEVNANESLGVQDAQETVVLRALREANPNLQSNKTFSFLMEQLTFSENQVAASRGFYNEAVTVANTLNQQFPMSLFSQYVFGQIPPLLSYTETKDDV